MSAALLIVTGALFLIAAVVAFAVRQLLFRDTGQRAAPRPPVHLQRIAQLPGIRAFRS